MKPTTPRVASSAITLALLAIVPAQAQSVVMRWGGGMDFAK